MTQKMSATPTGTAKKGSGFLRALGDLFILLLLLTAAGAGGYFWGLHQQLAPVEKVAPGTPGALLPGVPPLPKSESSGKKESKDTKATKENKDSDEGETKKASKTTESTESTVSSDSSRSSESSDASGASKESSATDDSSDKHPAKKYWLASSGAEYVGYSILVKVNGKPVDNFYGPGKIVDVTNLVKKGDNVLVCDAKELGDGYNKHTGDSTAVLTLQLVSAPHMTDSFKKSDVVLTCKRSATDSETSTDTFHFKKE